MMFTDQEAIDELLPVAAVLRDFGYSGHALRLQNVVNQLLGDRQRLQDEVNKLRIALVNA